MGDYNGTCQSQRGPVRMTISKHTEKYMELILAFLNGMREFRHGFSTHYASWHLNRAYDWGREWAHRLTFRRFEA